MNEESATITVSMSPETIATLTAEAALSDVSLRVYVQAALEITAYELRARAERERRENARSD